MKTNKKELKSKAHSLVELSKKNKILKPHTEAFDIYPVECEIHEGKEEYYITEKEELDAQIWNRWHCMGKAIC